MAICTHCIARGHRQDSLALRMQRTPWIPGLPQAWKLEALKVENGPVTFSRSAELRPVMVTRTFFFASLHMHGHFIHILMGDNC
jgi:hypothetical protein